MWRLLKSIVLAGLLIGAVIIGFVAVDQGYAPPRGELRNGAIASAVGLTLGLGVAWWRRIDWARFSLLLRGWRASAVDLASWTALACASIVVLFLY